MRVKTVNNMKLVIIAKIRETLTCSSSTLTASVVSLSACLLHRLNFHLDLIQTAAIYRLPVLLLLISIFLSVFFCCIGSTFTL